ncbi:MAG: 3-hydroxyanthranilate 3,4-dioxygenase [Chitinophagales bacterium]|jgi:3-hydroxyanthranilate 3,4-dioxygenase|nr:3-hydroxyanthranilate 3,4-dioxygenase [Chitinophagales bacterium]
MTFIPPFNLKQWIDENKDFLKPPVSNKNLYIESQDYIVMIVGGPNARKDYHYNETEELFYQIQGDIQVKVQVNGVAKTIDIREGEMFLLPAKIPHSPIRPENSIGLVIERKRIQEHKDGLSWYCDQCNHELKHYRFHLENIEKDFLPRFREFYQSKEYRTCTTCGYEMPVDSRYTQ